MMLRCFRPVCVGILVASMLNACANESVATTATAVPSSAVPSPTTIPLSPTAVTIADGVTIGSVDVGGLEPAAASAKLAESLALSLQPFTLEAGDQRVTISPESIDLDVPAADLVAKAERAAAGSDLPLDLAYDEAKLRAQIEDLAAKIDMPASYTVLSNTDTYSRSFALVPGTSLDVDAALETIAEQLPSLGDESRTITLQPTASTEGATKPGLDELQTEIKAVADQWEGGVVGVYAYDLDADKLIAELHPNTVFSAASTIKTPIMLNAYISRDSFTAKQTDSMREMIVASNNISANLILAASVNGAGTEDALEGTLEMSQRMADLGLPHTYLYVPFEAVEYLVQNKIKLKAGPARDGEAPYTDSGRYLRTTPAEMGQLYQYIYQCSQGKGVLIDRYERLNAKRCEDMIDLLRTNADTTRMVAGLPADADVAHKSGWVDDMQADAGIVQSDGGKYVLSVYVFRPLKKGQYLIPDRVISPVIASISQLVYSYYNPLPVDEARALINPDEVAAEETAEPVTTTKAEATETATALAGAESTATRVATETATAGATETAAATTTSQ